MSGECEKSVVEKSEDFDNLNSSQRQYITARRRSLSGSAVTAKRVNRKLNFRFKNEKNKFKANGKAIHLKSRHSTCGSTDCIHSDIENTQDSIDSNSMSISMNSSGDYQESTSMLFPNSHRTNISAKTKIKHFLAEHLVKIHHCHHPEYHFHKKPSETMITEDLKTDDLQEVDFPDQNSYGSSNSSSSKEITNSRSLNYTNIASNVLDRIRHMNIQTKNPTNKPSFDQESSKVSSIKDSFELSSNSHLNIHDSTSYFPSPEPNPCKLPKVISPSSIMFSSKLIASHKSKRHRLAHSVSLDPDYKTFDACRDPIIKKPFQYGASFCPEFSPEKDKWERKISGYLDTSTPTGAALTAINFGLKRVTETDKYVMITKSPILSPNEFLEEGINHLQDSKALYRSLLLHTNSYDLMPDSGKMIIIDSQMQIGKAFEALEDNTVRAAPIWNSEKQEFMALLTVNDLIPILLHLHQLNTGEDQTAKEKYFENFSTVTVEKSLNLIPLFRTMQGHISGVSPETNLYSVTNMLSQIRKSQVIVLDEYLSGNPLFLLTDLRILIYLTWKMRIINVRSGFTSPMRSENFLFEYRFEILKSLSNEESGSENLEICTFVKTQFLIFKYSTLEEVLRAMAQSYYTCALIVDHENIGNNEPDQFVINDVITISDILYLIILNKHRDASITAAQILGYRDQSQNPLTYRDPVVSCSIDESVEHLIDIVVKEKASFVLIRKSGSLFSPIVAILTPIDILIYISKQTSNLSPFSNHHCETHKLKRPAIKYSLDRLQHNSDITNKNSPKLLDDTLEEVFNMDVSEDAKL